MSLLLKAGISIQRIKKNIENRLVRMLVGLVRGTLSVIYYILFKKASPKKEIPKKIILLRSSTLGDFILSIPSMITLREMYPNTRLILLTIFSGKKEVRKAVESYISSSNSVPWLSFVVPSIIDDAIVIRSLSIKQLFRNVRHKIEEIAPDAVVILPQQFGGGLKGNIKKLLFLYLIGVRCPIYGWQPNCTGFFRSVQYNAGCLSHAVQAPLRAVYEIVGIQKSEDVQIKFSLDLKKEEEAWVEKFWDQNNLHGRRVMAIAPGSIHKHKQWPTYKFVELLRCILNLYDIDLVIVGTYMDNGIGQYIRKEVSPKILNLAGNATILQVASLLKRCSLLVGNDGGAIHLAAAVNCPCVSIISGIEYPGSIEPWGYERFVVRNEVQCAPCYSFTHCPRGDNKCIRDIPVQQVLASCKDIIDMKERKYSSSKE